jgi:ABC-type branched-subunit amino acid transport system substrate-binding protein
VQNVIARLRAAGVTQSIFATDGMDAQLNLRQYQPTALKDVIFASYGFPRPTSEGFFRAYKQRYRKVDVGSFPGLGLETVRTLAAAITEAGSTDPARIDAAFAKGFQVTGVGLAERRYPGGGARLPIADVGLVELNDGVYYPLESSIPYRVPAP